ncbi:MAG: CbtB-domain containing protein [Gammaproteobacteria bacterium]|jgi:cobalt transporter subunit CbtB|nr:CbtB-domain containing protein [Gammaproteobacteria bacterium]
MEPTSNTSSAESLAALSGEKAAATYASIAAIVLGVFLIAGTGLARPDVLHNAAHDARHAAAFPCH